MLRLFLCQNFQRAGGKSRGRLCSHAPISPGRRIISNCFSSQFVSKGHTTNDNESASITDNGAVNFLLSIRSERRRLSRFKHGKEYMCGLLHSGGGHLQHVESALNNTHRMVCMRNYSSSSPPHIASASDRNHDPTVPNSNPAETSNTSDKTTTESHIHSNSTGSGSVKQKVKFKSASSKPAPKGTDSPRAPGQSTTSGNTSANANNNNTTTTNNNMHSNSHNNSSASGRRGQSPVAESTQDSQQALSATSLGDENNTHTTAQTPIPTTPAASASTGAASLNAWDTLTSSSSISRTAAATEARARTTARVTGAAGAAGVVAAAAVESSTTPLPSERSSPSITEKIMGNTPKITPYQHAMYLTKLGAVANLGLAISKGAVGWTISSTGLIADAANSLGDLITDGVVFVTVTQARKRATPDRPWGTGKMESIGSLLVGGLLLTTGLGIGYSALSSTVDMISAMHDATNATANAHALASTAAAEGVNEAATAAGFDPGSMEFGEEYLTDAETPSFAGAGGEGIGVFANTSAEPNSLSILLNTPPTQWDSHTRAMVAALGVSGASIVAKEILFHYTLDAGRKANSSTVIANAWQHRADVGTSIAVFGGLLGAMAGFPLLDPFAALLVSGVIVRQAFVISVDSLRDLNDAPASPQETEQLRATCLSVRGVVSVEEIKARKSGPYLYVEVTVGVPGTISASAAHRLAELTRQELLRAHKGRVAAVVVDVDPLGSAGLGEKSPSSLRDQDYIEREIKQLLGGMWEVISVNEVQLYYKDDGHIAANVDIVLPPYLTIQDAHAIALKARKLIEQRMPAIKEVDIDLELDESEEGQSLHAAATSAFYAASVNTNIINTDEESFEVKTTQNDNNNNNNNNSGDSSSGCVRNGDIKFLGEMEQKRVIGVAIPKRHRPYAAEREGSKIKSETCTETRKEEGDQKVDVSKPVREENALEIKR